MAKRTDIHRPAAIIPAQYHYVLSYALATVVDGWPCPPLNIEEVVALQASKPFAKTGSLGSCTVCGARFVYGDIWAHENGEHIHIGHDCARKYSLLVDRSAFELEHDRLKAATAREAQKAINRERQQRFLDSHEGLEAALKGSHRILQDLADKLRQYHSLSDKQVALALKIAAEANKPAHEKEKLVPAAINPCLKRQTVTGRVVSAKAQEGSYGVSYKMAVKVETPEGHWLVWSTIPSALLDQVPNTDGKSRLENLRGATVTIKASLEPGREAHFAVAKRPHGELVKLSEAVQYNTDWDEAFREDWKRAEDKKEAAQVAQ